MARPKECSALFFSFKRTTRADIYLQGCMITKSPWWQFTASSLELVTNITRNIGTAPSQRGWIKSTVKWVQKFKRGGAHEIGDEHCLTVVQWCAAAERHLRVFPPPFVRESSTTHKPKVDAHGTLPEEARRRDPLKEAHYRRQQQKRRAQRLHITGIITAQHTIAKYTSR